MIEPWRLQNQDSEKQLLVGLGDKMANDALLNARKQKNDELYTLNRAKGNR